jgi:cytosine/adenosine deaminase-related metal-dependent hydrolase
MRFFDKEQRLLLVHNTFSESTDIKMAEHFFSNVFWCLCPNANLYIENKLPDIDLFRAMKSKITLGTDSLASNHQLSILNEIYTIQRHFEEIPLTELIQWGTLNGAELLGLENVLGSFERAKKPGVVHIDNIDLHTLKLTKLSKSHLIKKA